MTHVLAVEAAELRDPVTGVVLTETDDVAEHEWIMQDAAGRCVRTAAIEGSTGEEPSGRA